MGGGGEGSPWTKSMKYGTAFSTATTPRTLVRNANAAARLSGISCALASASCCFQIKLIMVGVVIYIVGLAFFSNFLMPFSGT